MWSKRQLPCQISNEHALRASHQLPCCASCNKLLCRTRVAALALRKENRRRSVTHVRGACVAQSGVSGPPARLDREGRSALGIGGGTLRWSQNCQSKCLATTPVCLRFASRCPSADFLLVNHEQWLCNFQIFRCACKQLMKNKKNRHMEIHVMRWSQSGSRALSHHKFRACNTSPRLKGSKGRCLAGQPVSLWLRCRACWPSERGRCSQLSIGSKVRQILKKLS